MFIASHRLVNVPRLPSRIVTERTVIDVDLATNFLSNFDFEWTLKRAKNERTNDFKDY